MKVVVTGAAGFIGSHTCEALAKLGHKVVGIDCFDDYLYSASIKRANAADLYKNIPGFVLKEADICDPSALAEVIDESVDVVCHLAALAGVRPSLAAPERYVRTNLEGTVLILEQCRKMGVDRIVCASSSSVYGARDFDTDLDAAELVAFSESDLCLQPASPYAASKRAGELFCSTYRDLYGLGITSLRFFTVYGPRQRPDMAIHKFVKAIKAGETITLFGDGSSRRDYTFISDIVDGVVASIEQVKPGSLQTYNLGGTVTTSLGELVAMIEEVLGAKATIERLPNQAGDVPLTFADVSLASAELGYSPKVSLRAGIESFCKWHHQQASE